MQWFLTYSRVQTEEYISKLGRPLSPRQYVELSGQLEAPAPLMPGKECPITDRTVGFVGPRAGLDELGKSKLFASLKIEHRILKPTPCCLPCSCEVYCHYICKMIPNCHLGDNEHVRMDLRYFSICTYIHTDQWFLMCGPGMPTDARRVPRRFVDTFI